MPQGGTSWGNNAHQTRRNGDASPRSLREALQEDYRSRIQGEASCGAKIQARIYMQCFIHEVQLSGSLSSKRSSSAPESDGKSPDQPSSTDPNRPSKAKELVKSVSLTLSEKDASQEGYCGCRNLLSYLCVKESLPRRHLKTISSLQTACERRRRRPPRRRPRWATLPPLKISFAEKQKKVAFTAER
jgi:hypothetical protein